MENVSLTQLNDEIAELETWLIAHEQYPFEDKVQVRLELISKQSKRELLTANN